MGLVKGVSRVGPAAGLVLLAVLTTAGCEPTAVPAAAPTSARGPEPALVLVEVQGAGPIGGGSSVVAATFERGSLRVRSEAPATGVAGAPSAVLLAEGLAPGSYRVDVTQELCGVDCGTADTRTVFSVLCREELTLLPGQAVALTASVAPGTVAAQCTLGAVDQG